MKNFMLFFIIIFAVFSCSDDLKRDTLSEPFGAEQEKEAILKVKDYLINKIKTESDELYTEVFKTYQFGSLPFAVFLGKTEGSAIAERSVFDVNVATETLPTLEMIIPSPRGYDKSDWTFENVQLIVIANDDPSITTLEAYEVSSGNRVVVEKANEPEAWMLILHESDHLVAVDKKTQQTLVGNTFDVSGKTFVYETENYRMFTIIDNFVKHDGDFSDDDVDPDPDGGGGDIDIRTDCDRDDIEGEDHLNKFKFESFDALQKVSYWWETLELRCYVTFNEFDGDKWQERTIQKTFFVERTDMWHWHKWVRKASTFDFEDVDVLVWNNYLLEIGVWAIGNSVSYEWLEIDESNPVDKVELSLSAPSSTVKAGVTIEGLIELGQTFTSPKGEVKVSISPKDDKLGASRVDYCGKAYFPGDDRSTGSFRFWIYEKPN